jgi:hypothetical protein
LEKESWLLGRKRERDGYSSLYLSPTADSGWLKELVSEAISQLRLLWFVNARTGKGYWSFFKSFVPSEAGLHFFSSLNFFPS